MTNEAQPDGIVLLCDINGIVQQVQQDELGLTDSHSTGRPFTALVHGDSLKTAFGFVEAVQSGEPAFGYGLFMHSADDKVLLHVNGYALDNQMVITGARSRVVGSRLYHRTLQSHHRQVNAVYADLAEARSTHAARESDLLDQVARLQADASTLSAELEQTYAAQTANPNEAHDQSQHVVELTLANGRLQAELARCGEAAEAQRNAEETFAAIFRAGPIGMAVSARSDGRLVQVNEQLERLLDYRRGELTGQPLHKLFAQGSRSVLGKVEAHLSVPHAPLEIATKLRMKDGTSRDLLAAFELTELNGELFLLTAVMEAHEHVQTEYEAKENEQFRRELTVQATALGQEVKLLHDDVRAYKQREQTLVDQAQKLREKIKTLEAEIVRREQREKDLSANIAAYQPEARDRTLTAQIAALQDSKQELTAQVAILQDQAAQAERAAGEHKEREQTLANQVTAVNRLNFRIEALHAAMEEELKKQSADLQQQQAGLESELARRRQSEDELAHLAANLLESASAHEAELAGFRQREQTLIDQLTEMRAGALLQELDLKAQLDGLHEQIGKLEELSHPGQALQSATSGLPDHRQAAQHVGLQQQDAQAPVELESRAQTLPSQTFAVREAELRVQISALHKQVSQLQSELDTREQTQVSQAAISQERADLLESQFRVRQEAETELLGLISGWRERVRIGDYAGVGVEREQALLEQIGRLEQHIQESAEASRLIVDAAAALRRTHAAQDQTADAGGRSQALAGDDMLRGQTEKELRNELGILHRQDQERIRQIALLQAQLLLRELELTERQAAPTVGTSVPAALEVIQAAEPFAAAPIIERPLPTLAGQLAASSDGDLVTQNAIASLARDATDLESALLLLAAEFGHQMHAEGSCLLMRDEARQELLPAAGYGLYAGPHPRLPFGQPELNVSEPSLTTGHSLTTEDARGDSSTGEARLNHGSYSTLSLPLTARGERLGVALITFDQSHHFTPDEIDRAERFAQQVALAIAHTRRQVDAQRRIEVLSTAQRAGLRLQPLRSREALAAGIRTILGESFDYEYAEVLLLETGTGELSTLLAGPRNPQAGTAFKFAELARRDVRTQVIRTGKSVRLIDVHEGPLREHAVLCIPLLLAEQLSGVLYLESSNNSTFTELDQQALEMVAASIAGAIENARAFDLIEQQHRQLRTLTMQLAGGEDTARRQMAHQLQIDVGQSLMMLSISLDNLSAGAAAAEGITNLRTKVDGAQQQVDEITRSVRDVIAELHPPALDELGLAGALRYYGGRFSERTGVPAIVNSETWVRRQSPAVEAVLFRIAQETLTQVNRFDPIKPIRISLEDNGGIASLSITGAGVGVSPAGDADLFRLQERAAAIGAELRVESESGREPRLVVELARAG
jgi:two-component system sensor histidine kinase UhpB